MCTRARRVAQCSHVQVSGAAKGHHRSRSGPGGQLAQLALGPAGASQNRTGHLEQNDLRQFAQVPQVRTTLRLPRLHAW